MKIEKKVLDRMERCYCTGSLKIDGEQYAVLASEAVDGPCVAYAGKDFSRREVIWEKAGGTMSFIQIPGTNGEFLAVQNFFPGFQSETAKIVWGRRDREKGWIVRDVLDLPYVHRFDIFDVGGVKWFFGATLCTSKKEREDWSDPGKIFVGILPNDLQKGIEVKPIMDNLTRNHGYWRGTFEGRDAAYVTCDSGVYAMLPPSEADGTFEIRRLLDRPVSDVAIVDIDGDGTDELVTIEPFHGSGFFINKKIAGEYEKVYSYPGEIEFAHALWGGMLRGVPTIVGGIRRKNCELFYVQCKDATKQEYETTVLETGVGTSNVAVIDGPDRDILISANHTKNEAAVYIVTD